MSAIHVRDAHAVDEQALARVFREASLSNAGDRDALVAHPEALTLSADLIARGRSRVATLTDGTVVGFATARPTDPGVLELDDLFVDPDHLRSGVAGRYRLVLNLRSLSRTALRARPTACGRRPGRAMHPARVRPTPAG